MQKFGNSYLKVVALHTFKSYWNVGQGLRETMEHIDLVIQNPMGYHWSKKDGQGEDEKSDLL